MATPNYGYEKRQKELAKKRKKEDKLRSKADRKVGDGEPESDEPAGDTVGNLPSQDPGSTPDGQPLRTGDQAR